MIIGSAIELFSQHLSESAHYSLMPYFKEFSQDGFQDDRHFQRTLIHFPNVTISILKPKIIRKCFNTKTQITTLIEDIFASGADRIREF